MFDGYFGKMHRSKATKGGFKSEDTGKFYVSNIAIPNHYPEQKIWISCLLFSAGNSNFSAQDSDLEYLCWRSKNSPVSFDLKPPLDAKTRKDYNPFCKHRSQAPPNCTLKFLDFSPKVLDFT